MIFFVSLTSSSLAFSQETAQLKLSLVTKITQPIKDFATDYMSNLYVVTSSNQVKKINEKGDSVASFNDNRRYGSIYSIDASNPLKVLVYYRDFSNIVILDRMLNLRGMVDLKKQNLLQVQAVAGSYDNNTWIFDELDNKLKKIDDSGKILFESSDFRQVFDSVPTPDRIYDRDGQLYLYDPLKGLIVFDYYGAKKNNLQLLHLTDLQVIDRNTITARDSNQIYLYRPASLQILTYNAFPDPSIYKKIHFNGNLLYCLTKEGELEIYKVLNN
jgi:hypothetical protein